MYVMFCYVVLCYVILCYVMLCYVLLCYLILSLVMYVCMFVCMFLCLYVTYNTYFLRKTITPDNLTLIKLNSTNENLPSILVNHHVLYPRVMFNILQPIHQHSVRVLKFDLHILLMIPIFRLFK